MIWEFSLPGPRIITIDVKCTSLGVVGEECLSVNKSYYSPNPAALRTCQSSRNFAMKGYKLAFGTHNVYVDYQKDILYFVPISEECEWGERPFYIYRVIQPPSRVHVPALPRWDMTHPWARSFLQFRHILLDYETVEHYEDVTDAFGPWQIRENLEEFTGLRTVSFCISEVEWPWPHTKQLDPQFPHRLEPGQIFISQNVATRALRNGDRQANSAELVETELS